MTQRLLGGLKLTAEAEVFFKENNTPCTNIISPYTNNPTPPPKTSIIFQKCLRSGIYGCKAQPRSLSNMRFTSLFLPNKIALCNKFHKYVFQVHLFKKNIYLQLACTVRFCERINTVSMLAKLLAVISFF